MIVGVDVSSYRIDLAWLENGEPQRWHQQLDTKAHLIDRLRSIRIQWPQDAQRYSEPGVLKRGLFDPVQSDVTDIAIEMPFGQSRKSVAALMATVGVVTRQAPPWARVAWPSAGELRAAIGAKNNKASAHGILYLWYAGQLDGWDEHELDALVACLGWARIIEQQESG